MDMALANNHPELVGLGTTVLTTAVLSIILTAPTGALAIALSGPRFLNRHVDSQSKGYEDGESSKENTAMLPCDSEQHTVIIETAH